MRQKEPEEFQRARGIENLDLQMPQRTKVAPEAPGTVQKAGIAKWRPMIKAADVKVD
jgi:hypothetical protein